MCVSPAVAYQSHSAKGILVLYWYNKDHPWNIKFDQRLQEVFQATPPGSVEYYAEYLESNRFPGDYQSELLRDYLKRKYADRNLAVLIATSDTSLDFLVKYRSELFPRTPIVFVSARHPTDPQLRAPADRTGIVNISTHAQTLDLALKLHPQTEHLFVVSGTLEHDKRLEAAAREDLRTFENRLQITYLTDLGPRELISTIKNLPERSLILYIWQQSMNDEGRLLESPDILKLVAQSARVPIYGMQAVYLGDGMVGGYINIVDGSASRAADMAMRIANGESPQNIAIENAPAVPMFDWKQLRRWGVDESVLPAGNIVLFKDITLWERYRPYIVALLILIVGQGALIGWLLIERGKRSRAEQARRHLAAIVESSKDAIVGSSLDDKIMSWNFGAEAMYGYTAAEVLGQHLSILVPTEHKKEFAKKLAERNRGEEVKDFEAVRLRKDGTRVDVSVSVSPIKDVRGKILAYATIYRDVSERKQAEQKLQHLTGQLIQVRDEEHRRIAAELHDGLGQSLSIIRNRATLCKEDISDQDSVVEQLDEISATAVSAIDEVREIAHNLRPYELDRLGLVAAIQSMINKLSGVTSIQLSSDVDNIDGLLSRAGETSIYRIVQEGLNNVIKHAEASEVRVVIKREGSEIVVSVQDNGKGIGQAADSDNRVSGNGFGLQGIAERARILQGVYSLDSKPGIGTKLTVRVRLKESENGK